MFHTLMSGKIHRAKVTAADQHYVGSISIDEGLMEAAGILPNERVQVLDIDNGARLETYTLPAPRGSGEIQINGAAAHLVEVGHLVIIVSYVAASPEEARTWRPTVVHVDEHNRVAEVSRG